MTQTSSKISELDPAGPLTGNELLAVVQGGVTKKSSVLDFVEGAVGAAIDQAVEDAAGTVSLPSPVITKPGAAENLLAADAGSYARYTNAGAKTLTVRPEATEALPANGEWHIRNVGAGNLTIVAGDGVTIAAPASGSLVVPQLGTVTLKRVAANTFDLFGFTVAA